MTEKTTSYGYFYASEQLFLVLGKQPNRLRLGLLRCLLPAQGPLHFLLRDLCCGGPCLLLDGCIQRVQRHAHILVLYFHRVLLMPWCRRFTSRLNRRHMRMRDVPCRRSVL